MDGRLSRRSYVGAASLWFATALAGCQAGGRTVTGSWPMRGYDAGYTYNNPDAGSFESAPSTSWRRTVTADDGSVALMPPLVGRQQVYVTVQRETSPDADPSRTLHAVSGSGSTTWRFEGVNTLQNGTIHADDVAVFARPATNGVVGVETDDGSERWQFEPDGGTTTRPRVAGDTAYFTANDGSWVLIDVTDGSQRRRFGDETSVYDRFVLSDDAIVAQSGDRGDRLRSIDASTGDVHWRVPLDRDAAVGPTLVDGRVLVRIDDPSDGEVVCVGLSDGAERWRTAFGRPIGHRLVATDGLAVVPVDADDGSRFAAVDVETGDTVWESQRTYAAAYSPVGTGQSVVAHDGTAVYALDLADGTQLWERSVGDVDRLRDLVVADSAVYLTGDRGTDGVLLALSG